MAYYFKLPTYDDLNVKQKVAVKDIGPIAIAGGPGTGKSVVAVWRHMLNYENDRRKSLLMTYTKSLRYFLAKSINSYAQIEEDQNKKRKILKAYTAVEQANSWEGETFDEIIVDEAQDLPEYCWITRQIDELRNGRTISSKVDTKSLDQINGTINDSRTELRIGDNGYPIGQWRTIKDGREKYKLYALRNSIRYIARFSESISFGADDNQILYPERATTQARLAQIFNIGEAKTHELHVNYRNTYEILNYVKYTLNYDIKDDTLERLKENPDRRGMLPILKLIDSYSEQNQQILQIIEDFNDGTANIVILLPLQAQVSGMCDFLSQSGYQLFGTGNKAFSKYKSSDEKFVRIDNIHVTTFKSVKGLEFDVVIIPYFGKYQEFINTKDVVNDEDYYVALTRARTNMLLISDRNLGMPDEVLKREHFEISTPSEISQESIIDDDLPF